MAHSPIRPVLFMRARCAASQIWLAVSKQRRAPRKAAGKTASTAKKRGVKTRRFPLVRARLLHRGAQKKNAFELFRAQTHRF